MASQLLASTIDMKKSAVLVGLLGRLSFAVFAAITMVPHQPCRANQPENWLVGTRLSQQLERPVTATWANASLRSAIQSFSQSIQIAVVLDRRIDAEASFTLGVSNEATDSAIKRIAERAKIGSSMLGPVVYFGPTSSAALLKTVAEMRRDEIKNSPPQLRKFLAQSRKLTWPELAVPRDLIEQLAREVHLEIKGINEVPHDLWAANDLPPLVWTDRMTLLLIQFGLTYQIDPNAKSIILLPLPETPELTRAYSGGAQPAARAKLLASKVPNMRIAVQGSQIHATGRSEDHEAIATLLSGQSVKTRTVNSPPPSYKLTIEGKPLDQVLAQLEKMLNLDLQFDHESIQNAGISLKQLITVRVEGATLDELLSAVLQSTKLTFERKDTLVKIRAENVK